MSFQAHITHTPTGLAITFAESVRRLDMAPDVAAHLASLIAIEARQRMLGVVSATEKTSEPRGVVSAPESIHPHFCDCDPCLNGERDA